MNKFILPLILALTLTACASSGTYTPVDELRVVRPVAGTQFTQHLTEEYRALVLYRQHWIGSNEAQHFARKGLIAAEGNAVLPEPLDNWTLSAYSVNKLRPALFDLTALLDAGGRVQAPFEAAHAQVSFDCWVMQQQLTLSDYPTCQSDFENAIRVLRARLGGAPQTVATIYEDPISIDVTTTVSESNQYSSRVDNHQVDQGQFLVYFDTNSAVLNDRGLASARNAAAQARRNLNNYSRTVISFAANGGPTTADQNLSMQRAQAVKTAIVDAGVDPRLITVSTRSELIHTSPYRYYRADDAGYRGDGTYNYNTYDYPNGYRRGDVWYN